MKSISLYFILVALLSNFNCGEAGSAKKDTPKNNFAEIKFISERIEVGVADGKTNVTQDFKFSNAGNIPLVISEVKGNCHCVQAKWPEKVEPGDSAVIHVSFDPTRSNRLISKNCNGSFECNKRFSRALYNW